MLGGGSGGARRSSRAVSDMMSHSGATGFESWQGHELRYLVNFVFHPSLLRGSTSAMWGKSGRGNCSEALGVPVNEWNVGPSSTGSACARPSKGRISTWRMPLAQKKFPLAGPLSGCTYKKVALVGVYCLASFTHTHTNKSANQQFFRQKRERGAFITDARVPK